MIQYSGAVYQEATASGSAFHGEPSVRGEDGARVDMHSARRERRHLERHSFGCHEGQLYIYNC